MHRLAPILHVLGLIVMVFGLSMLLPLTVSLVQGDDAQRAYGEAMLITLVSGLLLWLVSRRHYREMRSRDGFLLVVLVWSILPVFASLPLMFYLPDLRFTDAYFSRPCPDSPPPVPPCSRGWTICPSPSTCGARNCTGWAAWG